MFKIYDVTIWETNSWNLHMLPDFSKSKDKHAIKFGQLIKYNMRNIFLEKLDTKCGGETVF